MYTVPWIINNMISEPKDLTTSRRRPSDVELKAQKSLQQLNVPDWYANKCVASPKIIVDRRPFESRPAPWKDPIRNRASSNNARKNGNINGAVVGTVDNDEKVNDGRMKVRSEMEEFNELIKLPRTKTLLSTSKTFPKMSPSRKIQNINIVFPRTKVSSNAVIDYKNDDSTTGTNSPDNSDMSMDSLKKFTPQKTSTFEHELTSATTSTPIKNSAARSLTFKKTPRMKCPPPAVPKTSANPSREGSFRFRDESFSNVTKLAETEKILTGPVSNGRAITRPVNPQTSARVTRMNCPAPPIPSTPEKTSVKRISSYLEQSSMSGNIFLTPKKSTEMESIIKTEQRRSLGKSFVEEIIKELNSKCSSKVKSNYVSPTSKNFVKKLVRALEMGHCPKRDDEDEISISSSDVECKSESSSASVSMKDSDSGSGSDSDVRSSGSRISRESTFCSFSRALESHDKISRQSVVPYVDDENESVYWIPLPSCKLPRTSSLKNLVSRLSSSPNSEISTNSRNSNAASGWGQTFDKRQQLPTKQLFRIDETTIIDSGYSDRSETNSSRSSFIDESWYDSETTQTASEIGDDSGNGYLRQTLQPPPKIPHYRQRTFVV